MNEQGQDWGDFVNRYTSNSSRHSSPEREIDFVDMRLTPSTISPVFSSAEKQFCRRDNIDQCVAYLNQVKSLLPCLQFYRSPTAKVKITPFDRYLRLMIPFCIRATRFFFTS